MTIEVQAKPARKDRGTQALLFVAALIAIGGIAFAVGRLTATPAAAATAGNGNPAGAFPRGSFNLGQFGRGANGAFGGGALSGGLEGTVESIDGSTLTLKLANGSTATVELNGSTAYHAETPAAPADVRTGSKVRVQVAFAAPSGSADARASAPAAAASASGSFLPGRSRTFAASDVVLLAP